MAFITILTVGRLKHPYEHPGSREFFEVGYEVFQQASKSGHLIANLTTYGVQLPEEAIIGEGVPVCTLTVWETLESLYRFTYSGKHKQALRDRNKWIDTHHDKQPTYVLWWTENVKEVSWEEAFKRYIYYIQHGSTPFAFDYKHAFDELGNTFLVK